MILTFSGKEWATMGLQTPHILNKELGYNRRDNCNCGVQVAWGEGEGNLGDECSVNGGDGERFLSKLSLTFS